jgi:hypothetical protein
MYKPNPLDLKNISLPESLEGLMEIIAKNVHENWAQQRMSEGWTYGEIRDDEKKTTPCLVPYEELSEVEKNYDRLTAEQTLKAIIFAGFSIKEEGNEEC